MSEPGHGGDRDGAGGPAGPDGGRAAVEQMRRRLQRTWYPFFARFSWPTPIQLHGFGPLLEGRDALLCAPAAAGKTEAFIAPLLERQLGAIGPGRELAGPCILVLSPTRALANDLYRRLQPPLQRLGLGLARRTGDHPLLPAEQTPVVVITTPESLDSMLARIPRRLLAARAVVLDELHLLDGTVRGDQVRLLLGRLRALLAHRGHTLQAAITSATIHDPHGMAARYLAPDAIVVTADRGRPLALRYAACPDEAAVVRTIGRKLLSKESNTRKVLVFLQRRADVERLASLAARAEGMDGRVYAHHGSLSRTERERVEKSFLRDPSAVCFATLTLELGIDIGDVDLVVLVGPPSSVSSLLQRIGRGNRRSGQCRVLACHADSGERTRFEHLLSLVRAGALCEPRYVFRPSVLVQQAGSLLRQSPGRTITAEALARRLPADLARRFPAARLEALLAELARQGWLRPGRHGHYQAAEELQRRLRGQGLHTNLGGEGGVPVIDETTGHRLGRVSRSGIAERLALGGRSRAVLRQDEQQILVRSASGDARPASFHPRGRPALSRELCASLAAFLGVAPHRLPLLELPDGQALFHFQGSLRGALLARHLKNAYGWPVRRGSGLCLLLEPDSVPEELPRIEAGDLLDEAHRSAAALGRLAGAGPYFRLLPEPWRHEFLEQVLEAEALADEWGRAGLASMADDPVLCEVLLALAAARDA